MLNGGEESRGQWILGRHRTTAGKRRWGSWNEQTLLVGIYVWLHGVRWKSLTFLPCEHFNKAFIPEMLWEVTRGHKWASGLQSSVDSGFKVVPGN